MARACVHKLWSNACYYCSLALIFLSRPRPQNLAAARRALASMVFLLRSTTKSVQQRAAMSLARLAPEEQLKVSLVTPVI